MDPETDKIEPLSLSRNTQVDRSSVHKKTSFIPCLLHSKNTEQDLIIFAYILFNAVITSEACVTKFVLLKSSNYVISWHNDVIIIFLFKKQTPPNQINYKPTRPKNVSFLEMEDVGSRKHNIKYFKHCLACLPER